MKKTGKLFMYANLIFSLLVFASVLFIKQHVVIDVIGGIAVCEIGQLIAKKSKSARLFEKAESLIARKSYTETSNEKNS